ncbi:MAG: alpha/beta fold hydrolase [Halioglobus sp.]
MRNLLSLLFSVSLFAGCAGVEPQKYADGGDPNIATQVFYGTDRNLQDASKPSRFYGLKRGTVSYGVASVSVVKSNRKTTLEEVNPTSPEEFLQQLQAAVESAKSAKILVFVHGYNRSFHQVSKQIAEFCLTTGFDGVPVIWSWPSSRNPAGYLEDETNMRWSQPHLARFLRVVIDQSGAETVHLVGHSMGARGMTDVLLRDLLPGGINKEKIGEYVLLAPDIDAGIFRRDLAPQLVASGLHTTLYTSANDKALASAYALRRYPRAGDSSYGPVVVSGIETIDATQANKSILGHSYFEESDEVSDDLAELLNSRKPAERRPGLEYVGGEGAGYWVLQAPGSKP